MKRKWKSESGLRLEPAELGAARPRVLGSLGDHGNSYQTTSALEMEYPTLRIQVRVNLKGEYVITVKDDDSTTLLRSIAEEGNKVLLKQSKRRHKVVLQCCPLDLPFEAVEVHPQVASAQYLTTRWDNLPTRQVLLVCVGPPPAKIDLVCWGRYGCKVLQVPAAQSPPGKMRARRQVWSV